MDKRTRRATIAAALHAAGAIPGARATVEAQRMRSTGDIAQEKLRGGSALKVAGMQSDTARDVATIGAEAQKYAADTSAAAHRHFADLYSKAVSGDNKGITDPSAILDEISGTAPVAAPAMEGLTEPPASIQKKRRLPMTPFIEEGMFGLEDTENRQLDPIGDILKYFRNQYSD